MNGAIAAAICLALIGGAIKAAHLVTERRQHEQAMTRLFAPYSHVRTIDRKGDDA
jgi:hypothetical protein